jgi:hypothetical protein
MKRIIHVVKQYDVMITPFKPAIQKLILIMTGLALGMLAVYILVPVRFKNNAEPIQMDDGYRDQWIKGVAAEYLLTNDEDEARDKLISAGVTVDEVQRLRDDNVNNQVGDWLENLAPVVDSANSAAEAKAKEYPDPGFMNGIAPLLWYLAFLVIGILMAVGFTLYNPIMIIRRTFFSSGEMTAADIEREKRKEARKLESQKTTFEVPPVVQFMTTFMGSDDFYDDSFAIETEAGKFLGECGSSIANKGPNGVSATEIWMFSQNDIATLTQLFVSPQAYNDSDLRARLEPRGTLVRAEKDAVATLDAKSLRAQFRVVDVKYGEDPNTFERLTVEIAVWEKEGGDSGMGMGIDEFAMPPVQQMPPMAAPPPQQPMAPPPQYNPPPPQQPMAPPPQYNPPPAQQPMAPPPQYNPPPAQQPMAPPPQPQQAPPQQPMQPPPQYNPPPAQQPTMRPPQQPMQPPPGQPQMRPPQQPGRQPGQQPGQMRPPQDPPPSPFGDTNY